MLESNLNHWLRDGVKGRFKRGELDMNRIENAVGSGMPDIEGCLRGNQFWVESKIARGKGLLRIKWRPRQIPWLRRRWLAGGSCFFLAQAGAGNGARRYLIKGCYADLFEVSVDEETFEKASITHPRASAQDIVEAAARLPRH